MNSRKLVDGAGFFIPAEIAESLFFGSPGSDFGVDYLHALVAAFVALFFGPITHHDNVFLVH